MKYFRLAFLILALLPIITQAQNLRDTTLTMSDDVVLDAFYVLPDTPPPSGGYPAVLLVHGFGGSKNNNASLARSFALEGYAATAYSVRGQGASGGMFDFFTSERIIADLRAMVEFTRALPGVNPERIGVMGGSQGGIHAWNAAAYDMGVRAVISIVANGRFRENWLEDGALNWTFAAASLSPSVNFDPSVLDSITRARESGDFSYVRDFLTDASTRELESSVSTPVLSIVSYYDGFFDQNAALRQFAAVPSAKRIILYPAGHSLPNIPAQENYVMDVVARWFAYWLQDNEGYAAVASSDSAVVFFDAGNEEMRVFGVDEEKYWLTHNPEPRPSDLKEMTWFFTDEGLSLTPQMVQGERQINYVNLLGSAPQVFRSPPITEDMTIAPAPAQAVILASGTGSQYQMNVVLYDVDPTTNTKIPLTRCHAQQAGSEGPLQMEMNAVLHTVPAGHVLEARVHGGIALLPDTDNNFGNFPLGPVDNSTNTFVFGGVTPSYIEFNVLDNRPVSATAPPAAHTVALESCSPHPVSSSAGITFRVSGASHSRLTVYDSRGRRVAVLHDGTLAPGAYTVRFDARGLPAGLYVAVLQSGADVDRMKMLLVQ